MCHACRSPPLRGVRKNLRTARVTRLRFLPQIPKGSNLQPPVLETGALPIELGTYVPQGTFRRDLGAAVVCQTVTPWS